MTPQQQEFDDLTAMVMGLPRGAGVQQADDSAVVSAVVAAVAGVQQAAAASLLLPPLKTGMLPSV